MRKNSKQDIQILDSLTTSIQRYEELKGESEAFIGFISATLQDLKTTNKKIEEEKKNINNLIDALKPIENNLNAVMDYNDTLIENITKVMEEYI